MSLDPKLFRWDWRQQPDMEEIAEAVRELSAGSVQLQEVDTGTDEYAWTVSGYLLSEEERKALYVKETGG